MCLSGTEPTTQACALNGNQTCDLLVYWAMLPINWATLASVHILMCFFPVLFFVHEFCFGWSDASAHAIWIQVVFLDDMGSNLKPARALGMVTILVHDSDVALQELEKVTGMQVTVCALRQISCPSSACRYTRQNKRRIWLSGSSLLQAWLSCAGLLGGSSLPVSQSSRCPWRTSCSFRCSQWTEKQCSGSKNLY